MTPGPHIEIQTASSIQEATWKAGQAPEVQENEEAVSTQYLDRIASLAFLFHQTSKDERNAEQERKRALEKSLQVLGQLYVNTGKSAKANALIDLIYRLTNQQLQLNEDVVMWADPNPETTHPEAAHVAQDKAQRVKDFTLARRVLEGGVEHDLAFSGHDVNGYVENANGQVVQKHKLDRLGRELTEQDYLRIVNILVREYCHPASGRVRNIWDLSTHVINGREYNFGDKVEVISDPVDEELLRMYLLEAWNDGMIKSSNLQFKALECLIENHRVRSVAILPKELSDKGYTFKDVRQAPTDAVMQKALYSVLTNQPILLY